MEERTIKVDLATAKEWYKEGGFKKELALQAFTGEELTNSWRDIKTFEDALQVINIATFDRALIMDMPRQARAITMLSIIKAALNGKDWHPALNKGNVYYSWCRWYLKGDNIPKKLTKIADFKNFDDDRIYTLVDCANYNLSNTNVDNYNYLCANIGLLCCKSPEIAQHLTKYFGKIVFDAIYGQYHNYEWID